MKCNSQLTGIGLTAVVLLAGDLAIRWVGAQQGQQAPKVITAQEFRIVDKAGKIRARIGMGEKDQASAVWLYDETGQKALVTLIARPQNDSSSLIITGKQGQD